MLPFKVTTHSVWLCKHTNTQQEPSPALHMGNAAEINLLRSQEVQQSAQR